MTPNDNSNSISILETNGLIHVPVRYLLLCKFVHLFMRQLIISFIFKIKQVQSFNQYLCCNILDNLFIWFYRSLHFVIVSVFISHIRLSDSKTTIFYSILMLMLFILNKILFNFMGYC